MSYFGIPIRNGLPIGLGSVAPLASGGGSPFSPLSLFAGGAPGAWYDPSDYGATGTLFQDSAGTTPVTAVEQPVGLMLDKSQGLVMGGELVTNGGPFVSTTDWTGFALSTASATVSVAGSALRITRTGTSVGYAYTPLSGLTVGRAYSVSVNALTNNSIVYVSNTAGSTSGGAIVVDAGVGPARTIRLVFFATASTLYLNLGTSNAIGSFSDFDIVSVRELPGNHAFQSTSASRPVLSARYNLLTKTEQFDDAAWTKTAATITANTTATTDPLGGNTADLLTEDSSTGEHRVVTATAVSTASGTQYVATVCAKRAAGSRNLVLYQLAGSVGWAVYVDLSNGDVVSSVSIGGGSGSASVTPIGNGWYRVTVTFTASSTSTVVSVGMASGTSATYTGNGTSGIYIWGASDVPANQSTLPYQRVNTATDYNTTGFLPYLKFDGVDDSLSTNSISFTSTDKMSVFAGVRKLSDAALGMIAELSASVGANNGSFYLVGPSGGAQTDYSFVNKGTASAGAGSSGYAAPITNTLTGLGNISGDLATLRVNGAQVGTNSADQGTGNYGNYPLFIGRRNNASLPFNGQMYSMIIVGKAVAAGELSSTETYVNQKTGAYA